MEKILQEWLGKRYQETDEYRYQCVAWAKKFVLEYYGVALGRFGDSAINGWINKNYRTFSAEKFSQIPYQKGDIPPAGAIIFWGKTATNSYGHVAIVWKGSTAEKFVIIEQNGGRGSADGLGTDAIREVTISPNDRGNCLGWYIFKKFNKKIMHDYKKILEEEMKEIPDYEPVYQEHDEQKALLEIGFLRFEKKMKKFFEEKISENLKKKL